MYFRNGLIVGWTIAAGLTVALAMFAGPAQAQTLEQALAAAYRSNPQLLAERARIRALDEGVPRALAGWRPTVTVAGEGGKGKDINRVENKVTEVTTRTERYRTPYDASLRLQQPLYRGGRTEAEVERAEALVQRGRAQLLTVEQNVLLDAATAYTNLVRDQAVLDLNINNEQVLQRQLDATRDRFQVGEVTRTDVSQAEARLARARADRIQAEGNLTSARAAYLKTIGEEPGRLTPARPPENLPGTETESQRLAADNPTVVAARFNERAALADVRAIEGEFLPTLTLNLEGLRAHEAGSRGVERDTAEATVIVSVPLYQAGSVDARVRESKQTAGQRRIEIEDALRRAREDVTRNWEALQTARARISAFDTQIRAAAIALDGVEQEAKVGSRTVLDVLDAEQELLDAKVNQVRAQRDEIVAGHQLAAAIGRLNARDLGLAVELYDPAANYVRTRDRWWGTDTRENGAARTPR